MHARERKGNISKLLVHRYNLCHLKCGLANSVFNNCSCLFSNLRTLRVLAGTETLVECMYVSKKGL